MVLAADESYEVVAWDLATAKELRRSAAGSDYRMRALSDDSRHFAYSTRDTRGEEITVCDAIANTRAATRPENMDTVSILQHALALSPDKKQFAGVGMENDAPIILVYDFATGKEVHRLRPPTPTVDPDGASVPTSLRVPSALQFSPDGQYLVAP